MSFVKLPELKPNYTVAETTVVLNETIQGSPMASALFREAMVRSDMPNSFNLITNVELVPQYQLLAPAWKEISKQITLKDLTEQSYVDVWPDLSTLPTKENGRNRVKNKAPRIGVNNEYPAIALNESVAKVKAAKYGLRMPLTIEMIINDQLDILGSYPEALAAYMRTLEDIVTTESLVNDQGILGNITRLQANADLGTPINAALTQDSAEAALRQINLVEVHGLLANLGGARLIVPRQLKLQAERIVATPAWEVTDGSRKFIQNNPLAGVGVTVLDALSWVNTSASGATQWFLSSGTGGTIGRPSLVTGFLRAYPNPQTFISSPNALTPAGGLARWQDGSFLNDSIEFKVRHFVGSKLVFTEGLIGSSGLGV